MKLCQILIEALWPPGKVGQLLTIRTLSREQLPQGLDLIFLDLCLRLFQLQSLPNMHESMLDLILCFVSFHQRPEIFEASQRHPLVATFRLLERNRACKFLHKGREIRTIEVPRRYRHEWFPSILLQRELSNQRTGGRPKMFFLWR